MGLRNLLILRTNSCVKYGQGGFAITISRADLRRCLARSPPQPAGSRWSRCRARSAKESLRHRLITASEYERREDFLSAAALDIREMRNEKCVTRRLLILFKRNYWSQKYRNNLSSGPRVSSVDAIRSSSMISNSTSSSSKLIPPTSKL